MSCLFKIAGMNLSTRRRQWAHLVVWPQSGNHRQFGEGSANSAPNALIHAPGANGRSSILAGLLNLLAGNAQRIWSSYRLFNRFYSYSKRLYLARYFDDVAQYCIFPTIFREISWFSRCRDIVEIWTFGLFGSRFSYLSFIVLRVRNSSSLTISSRTDHFIVDTDILWGVLKHPLHTPFSSPYSCETSDRVPVYVEEVR